MKRFGDPLGLLSNNRSRLPAKHFVSSSVAETRTAFHNSKVLCLPTGTQKRKPLSTQGELFTVKELAARLKVTPRAVYGWISDGKLIAVYVGSNARVSEAALEAFLDGCEKDVSGRHSHG